ncbi:MAG TPA: gluconokinase [Yinghuangia sp.]|uniref:gluconokinase n=1 Tax=Yinghuangia sp. YIM S10712 TaxID=3436930 RepID=UPI002D0C8C88|nr:gluconokinase [Yinghuangia sp.]
MGVSGTGKTTVAAELAARCGADLGEGDDFHPEANIAKMRSGQPLDDTDRQPWLDALGEWLRRRYEANAGAVVTCSALKRAYRDRLRRDCPDAFFVHLDGPRDLIAQRLDGRRGHFFDPALLDSQLAALEPLGPDEAGVVVDIGDDPAEIARAAERAWRRFAEE